MGGRKASPDNAPPAFLYKTAIHHKTENAMTLAKGKIFINDMRFHARHGVLPQERLTGGEFIVSVEAECSLERAAVSDEVGDTISYADIYNKVKEEMMKPSRLLENACWRIGERIIRGLPGIKRLTVRLTKENPPMGADSKGAGVQLDWIND